MKPNKPKISNQFGEEQLGQTMPKRGGPYSRQNKRIRRDEVFKLHFDYGYSARKIAELMKINRNTINSDICYLYAQLQKENDKINTDDWFNKQFYRLEEQRARLVERLEKTENKNDILPLEKIIFGIDCKLTQTIEKMQSSAKSQYDQIMTVFNEYLKECGYKERYVMWGDILKVSQHSSDKIKQIIKSDKYQKPSKKKRDEHHKSDSDALSQYKF